MLLFRRLSVCLSVCHRGYHSGSPTAFRPGNPALCGSCPLVTPYYCRLGDLLCLFCVCRFVCTLLSLYMCIYTCIAVFVYYFVCLCMCILCFLCSLCCFPLQHSPSVLWYCWLGLLTCKNRLPYNLYCVGGDVKHCTMQSNPVCCHLRALLFKLHKMLTGFLLHTTATCLS